MIDLGNFSPALPGGHQFTDVQSDEYWSSTTTVNNISQAWSVNFYGGGVTSYDKGDTYYVWCLRGGQ